jgi:hypothetical protein
MSRDKLKERIQKIFSLADIRVGGDRQWDIGVNNDQFYPRVLRLGSLGLGESSMAGGDNFQWRLFTGVSHTEQNFRGENLDA